MHEPKKGSYSERLYIHQLVRSLVSGSLPSIHQFFFLSFYLLSLTSRKFKDTMTPIKVGVIGVTGMTGSHVAVELLNRGHHVVGISRNPAKLGHHERYEPRAVDLEATPIEEIAGALGSLDVVVNAYGPHTQLGDALTYRKSTCSSNTPA